jgi:hypothetical protein
MSKITTVLAVTFLSALLATRSPVLATETGGTMYPLGVEDFVTAALPPPGNYFINYVVQYSASAFAGANGQSLIPDFKVDATADALRFVHVTDHRLFGASYAMQVIFPFVVLNVTTPQGFQHKTGLGDITVTPFVFGWHSRYFHTVLSTDFNLPTGGYTKGDIANIGRNYYNAEPVFAETYLAPHVEVSTKLMYDLNGTNSATKYRSGAEFHLDYAAGYRFRGGEVGVGGYYYKQVTDDTQNGIKVGPDGFRGQTFSIGPALSYNVGHASLVAKYEHESHVIYRPVGNKYVLKLITKV